MSSQSRTSRSWGMFTDYRQGLVPLIVPVTLLKHHLADAAEPRVSFQDGASWVALQYGEV